MKVALGWFDLPRIRAAALEDENESLENKFYAWWISFNALHGMCNKRPQEDAKYKKTSSPFLHVRTGFLALHPPVTNNLVFSKYHGDGSQSLFTGDISFMRPLMLVDSKVYGTRSSILNSLRKPPHLPSHSRRSTRLPRICSHQCHVSRGIIHSVATASATSRERGVKRKKIIFPQNQQLRPAPKKRKRE